MIELKIGGVYRARNGKKVEIVDCDDDPIYPFRSKCGRSYTPQGTEYITMETPLDLIEEWKDEPKLNEWIGWNGGECPVHPDTVVEVVGGVINPWRTKAKIIANWSNVTAYRIIKPYAEPREFWVKGDVAYDHGDLGGIHVREVMPDE